MAKKAKTAGFLAMGDSATDGKMPKIGPKPPKATPQPKKKHKGKK